MPKPIETCKKCGKKAWANEGISTKNNKPYKNIKCADNNCGHIEWLDIENKPSPETSQAPTRNENKASGEMILIETMDTLTLAIRDLIEVLKGQKKSG